MAWMSRAKGEPVGSKQRLSADTKSKKRLEGKRARKLDVRGGVDLPLSKKLPSKPAYFSNRGTSS